MLYLSISLVVLGLLCFFYVSFYSDKMESKKKQGQGQFRSQEQQNYNDFIYTEKMNQSTWDERILAERNIYSDKKDSTKFDSQEASNSNLEKSISNLDTNEFIQKSEEVISSELDSSDKFESFQMEGILYIDYSNKIQYDQEFNFTGDYISPEKFKGIKRLGNGVLKETKDGFVFELPNYKFYYKINEIKKLVFYNEGISVIPDHSELPTSIFFSEQLDNLKLFLESSKIV